MYWLKSASWRKARFKMHDVSDRGIFEIERRTNQQKRLKSVY